MAHLCRLKSLTMVKRHFNHFSIAGFTYYQGPEVFEKLKIGTVLELLPEANNKFDPYAVAIFFEGKKIGFVPRSENHTLLKLLEMGYGDIFETRIQRINPTENPEQQIQVIIYLLPKK